MEFLLETLAAECVCARNDFICARNFYLKFIGYFLIPLREASGGGGETWKRRLRILLQAAGARNSGKSICMLNRVQSKISSVFDLRSGESSSTRAISAERRIH